MMKKLLTLLVVFAMTSAASASYVDILVNGESWGGEDVEASDIISIILVDDSGGDFIQNINVGTTTGVSLGDTYSHTWTATPIFSGSTFTPDGDGYTWAGNWGGFSVAMPAEGILFVQEFHVPDGTPASTDILVEWNINYAGDGEQYSDEATIHVIPEPATIALLGLGGLFLRRRKKA